MVSTQWMEYLFGWVHPIESIVKYLGYGNRVPFIRVALPAMGLDRFKQVIQRDPKTHSIRSEIANLFYGLIQCCLHIFKRPVVKDWHIIPL